MKKILSAIFTLVILLNSFSSVSVKAHEHEELNVTKFEQTEEVAPYAVQDQCPNCYTAMTVKTTTGSWSQYNSYSCTHGLEGDDIRYRRAITTKHVCGNCGYSITVKTKYEYKVVCAGF